jgi:hypothetical protein
MPLQRARHHTLGGTIDCVPEDRQAWQCEMRQPDHPMYVIQAANRARSRLDLWLPHSQYLSQSDDDQPRSKVPDSRSRKGPMTRQLGKAVPRLRSVRRTLILLVILAGLLLGACSDVGGAERADVVSLQIQSMAGNPPTYFAIAQGYLPDQCTTVGRAQQRVAMRTIVVTLFTKSSDGPLCAPVLVPFRERIRLDVRGLSAGQYSVDVNGAVTTLNLMEDH